MNETQLGPGFASVPFKLCDSDSLLDIDSLHTDLTCFSAFDTSWIIWPCDWQLNHLRVIFLSQWLVKAMHYQQLAIQSVFCIFSYQYTSLVPMGWVLGVGRGSCWGNSVWVSRSSQCVQICFSLIIHFFIFFFTEQGVKQIWRKNQHHGVAGRKLIMIVNLEALLIHLGTY